MSDRGSWRLPPPPEGDAIWKLMMLEPRIREYLAMTDEENARDDRQAREIRAYSDRLMADDRLEAAILLVAMLGEEAVMRIDSDLEKEGRQKPTNEWRAEQRIEIARLLRRITDAR